MIYLVRHGESTANKFKRFCGITDVELSDIGKIQAYKAGMNLKEFNISHIFSSPLKRAYDTARIISEIINTEVEKIECLIEVNFGMFENMTWEEMQNNYKDETVRWIKDGFNYKFPEGESYGDIMIRISDFMENVEDGSLVVSHFGVIQSILLYYGIANSDNLWDYNISNCDIVVINNRKLERIIKCN